MDAFHETAKIYYQVSPKNIQDLAQEFFKSMNPTDAKKIKLHEFLNFMAQEGYTHMNNRHFFKELSGGSDELDFWQVMTLFYIVKSGRGFCGGCGCFLYSSYFTCVECFDTSPATFSVCRNCFRLEQYTHKRHDKFLDEAVLLETKRQANLNRPAPGPPPARAQPPREIPAENYTGSLQVVAWDPNAPSLRRSIFRSLDTILNVASSVANLCSIM